MLDGLPEDWRAAPADRINGASLSALEHDLAVERARTDTAIYPPEPDVFAALRLTPLSSVRAVILGQDPYSQDGLATGLAFSIPEGCKQPRSLQNILKARRLDLGRPIPSSGSLEQWAKSGVLLLNTALTVRRGVANSHRLLWKEFTTAVIQSVAERQGSIPFLLWGRQAQRMCRFIPNRHPVVDSLHPAARRGTRRFVESKPFSRADAAIHDLAIWSLPGDS